MSAYLIMQIQWKTPEARQRYIEGLAGQIERHGGKWLVASSEAKVIEGEWRPGRTIVAEFPTVKELTDWYDSEEYRPLKEHRIKNAACDTIVVQGAP